MSKALTYAKMAAVGAVCIIGGPALTFYLMPDPDELFKRYNPELQKRSLAERDSKLAAHADFFAKLQEYSKSDRPIWELAKEAEQHEKAVAAVERKRLLDEQEKQKRDLLEEQRRAANS